MSHHSLRVLFFFSLTLFIGCGSDVFDQYLDDGGTLHVGEVERLSTRAQLTDGSCSFQPGQSIDCVEDTEIVVGLPPNLEYAGDPEAVYDLGDFLFGEHNLEEPTIVSCGQKGKMLVFSIPAESIDVDDEVDNLLVEIGDSLLDALVLEFRFNVRGVSSGTEVAIHIENASNRTFTCDALFATPPERSVDVSG